MAEHGRFKTLKCFIHDEQASAIPMILFILGLLGAGAMYSLFFIIVGIPTLSPFIPDSMFKTLIIGIIYFSPFVVLIVGVLALMQSGMKWNPMWRTT